MIVFNVAVGWLTDALTDIILGVRTGIGVGALAGVNVNVFAGVMTAFKLSMLGLLEVVRC